MYPNDVFFFVHLYIYILYIHCTYLFFHGSEFRCFFLPQFLRRIEFRILGFFSNPWFLQQGETEDLPDALALEAQLGRPSFCGKFVEFFRPDAAEWDWWECFCIYLPIVLDEWPKLYGRSIRMGKSSSLIWSICCFFAIFP